MKVCHAVDALPAPGPVPGIFLAGPTPRSREVESWRPRALEILDEQGWEGAVYVPEAEGGGWHGVYEEQVEWEWEGLARATCVLFWIPRDLATLPGFTTNVEFGFVSALRPETIVLGGPEGAPKLRYLQTLARGQARFRAAFGLGPLGLDVPQATSLENALYLARRTAATW